MMTLEEKAKFTLAVISNEQLQISAAMAIPMAECQEWLKELTGEKLKPKGASNVKKL